MTLSDVSECDSPSNVTHNGCTFRYYRMNYTFLHIVSDSLTPENRLCEVDVEFMKKDLCESLTI